MIVYLVHGENQIQVMVVKNVKVIEVNIYKLFNKYVNLHKYLIIIKSKNNLKIPTLQLKYKIIRNYINNLVWHISKEYNLILGNHWKIIKIFNQNNSNY
jgi:hypothetical protein